MGEIDWIPDGRCSTQEAAAQEESPMEATVKLIESRVREIRFTSFICRDMHTCAILSSVFRWASGLTSA